LCGVGVALRGNLILLALLTLMVMPILASIDTSGRTKSGQLAIALMIGVAVPTTLLSLRNHSINDGWSPLPSNGGIVLHQVYNPQNPQGLQFAPDFVRAANPALIWEGYHRE